MFRPETCLAAGTCVLKAALSNGCRLSPCLTSGGAADDDDNEPKEGVIAGLDKVFSFT